MEQWVVRFMRTFPCASCIQYTNKATSFSTNVTVQPLDAVSVPGTSWDLVRRHLVCFQHLFILMTYVYLPDLAHFNLQPLGGLHTTLNRQYVIVHKYNCVNKSKSNSSKFWEIYLLALIIIFAHIMLTD